MSTLRAKRQNHKLSYDENGKRTQLHTLWLAIRNRCNNPKGQDYKYYGGRGIRVCDRWDRYVLFVEDVGPHPGPGWTLDRIDGDKDYEPGNVRWATRETQARNRNYCTLTEADAAKVRELYGPYKRYDRARTGPTQAELARMFGVTQGLISAILRGDAWK